MDIKKIFDIMTTQKISDVFIRAHGPLRGRILTEIRSITDYVFTDNDISNIISTLTGEQEKESLKKSKSCEFAVLHGDGWRFRIGIFYERGAPVIVIRKIDLNIPTFSQLNLPEKTLEKLCNERRGIILLTGITGSGKSTTIASMVEFINKNFAKHILTIEEPIEFTFKDQKSMITQREIRKDVMSYEDALKEVTFHSPDVVYIGNIRDRVACHAALTAAETGILVLSTLHSVNATSTIERIVNFFPPEQHELVFNQLSFLLKGTISLRLLPRADMEGLIPAYEIMTLSPTVAGLINKRQIWDIPQYITSSEIFGMNTFNQSLWNLIKAGNISPQVGLENSDDRGNLELLIQRYKSS